MRTLVLVLAMLLAGCGKQDRFAAGTWQVEAWMDSDLGSGKNQSGVHQAQEVRLSKEQAAMPPASVFFGRFYHGVRNAEVRFENGRVSGSFEQARVDDIEGHTVPISGTYGRDRFHVTFEYTAFGMKVRQVVEGKLVTPA